jgi:hypothetical protein
MTQRPNPITRAAARTLLTASLAISTAIGVSLSACTVDVVPVHSSRVNSAKFAEEPLLRGPNAPRAFKHEWTFEKPEGYLYDPSDLAFENGFVRFRPKLGLASGRERVAQLVFQTGPWFEALDSFKETTGAHHKGLVRYQLSHDQATWYFHDGKKWVPAGPAYAQANSAEQVSAQLGKFHSDAGEGRLVLKVFLVSPTGAEAIDLKSIEAQGIAPRTDGWN